MPQVLLLLLAWLQCVHANTEKTIFLSPAPQPIPDASIDNLLLTPLSERHPTARVHVNASFPTADLRKGSVSWFLLEALHPHRRYEVRICWPATQPTSFGLEAYSSDQVFADAHLLTSLSNFSYARHAELQAEDILDLQQRQAMPDPESTFLFLQVTAAADYFSLNQTLMEAVPQVAVDIILDPYIFNVFPKSLLPTGLYLTLVAVAAWSLSTWLSRQFTASVAPQEIAKKPE